MLEWPGHPDARLLHGGSRAWGAGGGALATAVPALRAGALEPAPVPAMGIGADERAARAGTAGLVPIDTRDDLEWAGRDRTACCARRGRIPGAVHAEWTEFLEGGRFRSPEAILALLPAREVAPSDELVP